MKKQQVLLPTQNYYFNKEVENAIISYLKSNIEEEKNKLFTEKIWYAFDKLAENNINVHKFYNTGIDYDTLKLDVISYLVQQMHHFDASRSNNAFSFFNTLCLNYLKSIAKKRKRDIYYEEYGDALISDFIHDENKELIIYIKKSIEVYIQKKNKSKNKEYLKFLQGLMLVIDNYELIECNKKYLKEYIHTLTSIPFNRVQRYMGKAKKEIIIKSVKKYQKFDE